MTQQSPNGTVYELSGPEDAPVIALVHGLGLNRHTWRAHEPVLSTRYRILNYDLFGHGESAPPPIKPTLSLFAMQLRDLLDFLNIEQCAVVGFSLGGMINRRFALDYPERAWALGILNSPHERGDAAQEAVEARAAKSAAGGPGATLDTTLKRWLTPEFLANEVEMIANIRQWVLANEPEVYAQCRWVLANGVIEIIRPKPPLTLPTLVMTCENDTGSTPAMSHAIASEIPNSQTIIVPHLQHLGLLEQPHLFTKPVMQFLDGVLA
ncbi:MAG: alpha/beta fold hydrolase [Candidatus Promineifilaceae bacterium]